MTTSKSECTAAQAYDATRMLRTGGLSLYTWVRGDVATVMTAVFGPPAKLEDATGEYGDELIRSLETYIEHNGQWERAARELYCHRHTLRYRMRKVEELTGLDLGSSFDRMEFWLALRARDLLVEDRAG